MRKLTGLKLSQIGSNNGSSSTMHIHYTALLHTMDIFVPLFTELFEQYELHYILTGKFQTYNLEARFGLYRILCGSNYLVSVIKVLQSEKKNIKIERLA